MVVDVFGISKSYDRSMTQQGYTRREDPGMYPYYISPPIPNTSLRRMTTTWSLQPVYSMDDDVTTMDDDVTTMDNDVTTMDNDVTTMDNDVSTMDDDSDMYTPDVYDRKEEKLSRFRRDICKKEKRRRKT
jgi:hypothetical protein